MRIATEDQLICEAYELGYDQEVPTARRDKAGFGEKLACRCFKLFSSSEYFYQMVDWPREYAPGFDVVFLAYRRADVQRAAWATGGDLGLLEPWDVGKPELCFVVEAKCSSKRGGMRTYLTYNRRRQHRQMSKKWIQAVFDRAEHEWMHEMINRYLSTDRLRRSLMVRLVQEKRFLVWHEDDFIRERIDLD